MAAISPTPPQNFPPTNSSHELHPHHRKPAPAPIRFTPQDIHYEGGSGRYLVDAGGYYRSLSKRSPVLHGLTRHFMDQGAVEKEAREVAIAAVADAELDRHVEWAGNLAGHPKGLTRTPEGKPLLILSSPPFAQPRSGPMPLISALIRSAFPDHVQREIFLGWLAHAYRSVATGTHRPQPMLVLAGEPGAGKSLLAHITGQLLGGRVADPHATWSGETLWNDHLCAAELLLLDDSTSTTDIRSRLNFAGNFKTAIYGGTVQMHKRHSSSMTVRPVWNVMVCCNNTPENLLVIPPINADMADKVAILSVHPIQFPATDPGDTPITDEETRTRLQHQIRAELPALAHHLRHHEIPQEFRDPRGRGVRAWRDPELMAAFDSSKPEHQLEEILEASLKRAPHLWQDLPADLTAIEIKTRLEDRDSPVRDQVRELLRWNNACGTYLGRLAEGGSGIVAPGTYDGHGKRKRYRIIGFATEQHQGRPIL